MCRLRTNFARLGDPLQGLHNRNAPLLVPAAPLLLKGSMSLDFRVAAPPYKSSSFATPEGEVCSTLGLCSYKNRDGKHRANLHLKVKRLTMICASLLSFKSCSLCTPPGWQANTIRREAQRPENRVRRFPVERCRRQKGCISNAPAGAVCLFSIARKGGFMVLLAHQYTSPLPRFYQNGAEGAHHNPLNLLNLLNPLNPRIPSARQS